MTAFCIVQNWTLFSFSNGKLLPNVLVYCSSNIGSIFNYHFWHFIHCDRQVSVGSFHVKLYECLLCHPCGDMIEDNLRPRYLQKSLRNYLIYYILNENSYPKLTLATFEQAIRIDMSEKTSYIIPNGTIQKPNEQPAKSVGNIIVIS